MRHHGYDHYFLLLFYFDTSIELDYCSRRMYSHAEPFRLRSSWRKTMLPKLSRLFRSLSLPVFALFIALPAHATHERSKSGDIIDHVLQRASEASRPPIVIDTLDSSTLAEGGNTPALSQNDTLPGASTSVPEDTHRVTLFEEYKLGENAPAGLWNLRKAQQREYRSTWSWPTFKDFVCKNSPEVAKQTGNACTDEALSGLKKGTVVRIPASRVLVSAPQGSTMPTALVVEPLPTDPSVFVVTSNLVDREKTMGHEMHEAHMAGLKELSDENKRLERANLIYALITLVLFVTLIIMRNGWKKKLERCTRGASPNARKSNNGCESGSSPDDLSGEPPQNVPHPAS
jgi:hypothetical protein